MPPRDVRKRPQKDDGVCRRTPEIRVVAVRGCSSQCDALECLKMCRPRAGLGVRTGTGRGGCSDACINQRSSATSDNGDEDGSCTTNVHQFSIRYDRCGTFIQLTGLENEFFIDAIVVKVRRRAGREPTDLRDDPRQSRRPPGRARFVGRDAFRLT